MVAQRQEEPRAPLRVLIVEDSEDDALLLLRGGYEVVRYERVETSEAMKKALAVSKWDVIFSDYQMPRFRALEALELAQAEASEAPFIVVSGKVGEDVAVRMVKAGAYDYVMKDNMTRLGATIGRGLEEAEERRDRRRAEKEFRQSEERYRAVIEQATDGIYLLDAGTRRLLETNPAFQKMLGYSADELLGMEVYDFVAHERENVDSTIQRTLEQRRRSVGERKYYRKAGTLVDVEVGVSVIFHGGREVICTIVRDITERKRAEEALARSENRLRTIIETEPECIKVLGMDGSLLEMNPAGLSMIEADSLEQVRGQPVYEYIAPEHRTDFVALTSQWQGDPVRRRP